MKRPTVILRECPEYDVERIEEIVADGLDLLELRPHGRTLIKPNCVASGTHFPHAHTRPEFLEGLLRAVKSRAVEDVEEIAVGERCGITMPTRYAYKGAGFYDVFKRTGVEHYHFEEETQVEIPLYHKGRLRDAIFTPEPVAKSDFFINAPKFKAHPWTTVTFSLKAYIGIQDDRHRLIDHDHKLDEKLADLQYIIQPQFIAIDAITAGEGRMLTPIPFDMGMVMMGDNQVAFDAVCCHIIGLDPMEVPHIRMAHEHGFGPVDLDAIEIVGDLTLAQAKEKADGFRVGLIRVEEYFEGTNIKAYAGPPPGGKHDDYCWGGCPGAMEEAIEICRLIDDVDSKMPKTHLVFGNYKGEIDAKPGEKVIFIGDCATFKGTIGDEEVEIESLYVDRSELDPRQATETGIYGKMLAFEKTWFSNRNDQVMRLAGCPVSVAEQVLLLVKRGKLKNPYFDPAEAVGFTTTYMTSRTKTLFDRMLGKPYQVEGPTERGASRPSQNLPPEGSETPLEAGQDVAGE